MLQEGGVADIRHSGFQENVDATSFGIGIVNLGGEVQCDLAGCFPVCTVCQSSSPTPQPTVEQGQSPPPTPRPSFEGALSPSPQMKTIVIFTFTIAAVAGFMIVVICVVMVRRACRRGDGYQFGETRFYSNQQPLLRLDGARNDHDVEPEELVELVEYPVMRSYEFSPAPVFVVAQTSMRIVLWSPGMAETAPMALNPVGCLLSDLPFVNASDGYRLHRVLGRIFEAPARHEHTRTFMLHMFAGNRHVLLDMVAAHVSVTESESIIVMTGRVVDSGLAGLMACKSAMSPSEANHDVVNEDEVLRSVSQAGSIKGGDDNGDGSHDPVPPAHDKVCSAISSITMPSMVSHGPVPSAHDKMSSAISSITMPSMESHDPVPSAHDKASSAISSITMSSMASAMESSVESITMREIKQKVGPSVYDMIMCHVRTDTTVCPSKAVTRDSGKA